MLLQLAETAPPAASQAGTALCFSGGVDSFYALLRGPTSVDLLICAIGYDVKIRAGNRRNRLEPSIRSVAAETGKRVVVVYVFASFRFAATRFGAWRLRATVMPIDRGVSPIAARERTSKSIDTELSAASIFATRD